MNQNKKSISKSEIDMEIAMPIYAQLANLIRQKIDQKIFNIGEMLPTEKEICDAFSVSRSTIRKAFSLLESEGKIIRKRGKGTFVAKPKLRRGLNNLYNFSTEMRMLGLTPRSELISFDIVKPTFKIETLLNISENDLIYQIKRLRIANDLPMLLETAYIPQKYCPQLSEHNLTDSLYTMITEYTGAEPMEAVETYDVTTISEQQAKLLQCSVGAPAFKIRRVSTNSMGNVFEVSTIIAPGERNRYQISLKKEDISISRKID